MSFVGKSFADGVSQLHKSKYTPLKGEMAEYIE